MPLVFAGVCSHAPGITGRAERADPVARDGYYAQMERMRQAIVDSGADALVVIAAEHFANFFMNNMPAYAIGMGEEYEGPIEDPDWLKIPRTKIPGNPDLSKRIITEVMQSVDVAYAEEWKMDHGIMVPLHFLTPNYDMDIIPVNINCQGPPLTPLHRTWEFGRALRRACDAVPEKIAVIGTGGISHWPATPNSGKINETWDREFLNKWQANDKEALLSYTDEETLRDAGQGGFEIRAFTAISGLCEEQKGELWFYEPIPIFAVGCTVGVMQI
ncbi:MAG: extradiol ring-cleavage dioxygenase [Maricaulaceae bacterium]